MRNQWTRASPNIDNILHSIRRQFENLGKDRHLAIFARWNRVPFFRISSGIFRFVVILLPLDKVSI